MKHFSGLNFILFCYSYKWIFSFLKKFAKFAKTGSDVVCLLNFSVVVGNVWFEKKLARNIESKFFQFINIAEHCKVCISFGGDEVMVASFCGGCSKKAKQLFTVIVKFKKYKFYHCSFYDSVPFSYLGLLEFLDLENSDFMKLFFLWERLLLIKSGELWWPSILVCSRIKTESKF